MDGLRDGQLISLEKAVKELTADMAKMKLMMYALYGAIALINLLPDIKGILQ